MGMYRTWTCGMCLRKMLCLSYRRLKWNANILYFLKKKKKKNLIFGDAVGTGVAPSKRFSQGESEQGNSVFLI